MKHVTLCLFLILSSTMAFGQQASHYPNEIAGQQVTWQSRSSMYLTDVCVKQKCDPITLVSGEPILLGAVYFYGTDTIVLQFHEQCIWDGEVCDLPTPTETFSAWLTWNEDAQAYLQVIDISEKEAEFISLTMDEPEVGTLRIGVFDVVGNGKVFKYSKDYERQVFRLQRWFPPMVPDPGPV